MLLRSGVTPCSLPTPNPAPRPESQPSPNPNLYHASRQMLGMCLEMAGCPTATLDAVWQRCRRADLTRKTAAVRSDLTVMIL